MKLRTLRKRYARRRMAAPMWFRLSLSSGKPTPDVQAWLTDVTRRINASLDCRPDQFMVHPAWMQNEMMRQYLESLEYHGAKVYVLPEIDKPAVRMHDWNARSLP